jgi:translation initiation factor 1A
MKLSLFLFFLYASLGMSKKKENSNTTRSDKDVSLKPIVYKEFGQDYAQVKRLLGGCHLEATCFSDGTVRLCHIRGQLRNKIWIYKDDIILISMRDFEEKADVLHRYKLFEARYLQKFNEIPSNVNLYRPISLKQSCC